MILPDDTPPSPTKVQRDLVETARITNPTQEPGPPPYAGYSSYQRGEAIYPVASPSGTVPRPWPSLSTADIQIARRRAVGRFFTAFVWALLVWVLSGVFIRSLIELAHPSRGFPWFRTKHQSQDIDYSPGWPKHSDGTIKRCFSNQDPWVTSSALPMVTFDLPASSDALYLFSRGSLATGHVMFRQEPSLNNGTVTINVVVSHRTSETSGLVSICSLERSPGERGIGFFTPEKWHSSPRAMVEFTVIVNFPVSDEGLLRLKTFETRLPLFAHHMDNLLGKVTFDSLSLQSTNAHLNIVAASAVTATIKTTNGHIVGNFTTSKELSLITTNGLISANVKLHNADSRSATKLKMKTTNSHLSSYVDLISDVSDHRGGSFDVEARTTNGPLSIGVPVSPFDSLLNLTGWTTNAAAVVTMNPQYEGAFHLATSANSGIFVHYNPDAEDPEGLGRQRVVDIKRKLRGVLDGAMFWGSNTEEKKLGDMTVRTSNGPVSLVVV